MAYHAQKTTGEVIVLNEEDLHDFLYDEIGRFVDLEEEYSDLLDECYPIVDIGCCTFNPSEVLKACDPVAFKIGAYEYLDSLIEDWAYEITHYDWVFELNGVEVWEVPDSDDEAVGA